MNGIIVATSCGIRDEDFCQEFYKIVSKDELANKKILYITTAVDGEDPNDDRSWMDHEFATMLELGFSQENIAEYKIGDAINVLDFDIIYMMGGNSFYLMDMIRKYHFDEEIRKFLAAGKIYIGSSAGSQVLGTSVKVSADENRIGMTDFTALGLIDGLIIPHANRKEEFIREWREKTDETIIELFDGGGIIYK